jgi:hypothetical protein
MSGFTFTIAPSGQFVSTQSYAQGTATDGFSDLWNPGVFEHLRDSFQLEAYEPLTSAIGDFLRAEHKVIKQSDFDRYGEVLIRLAATVSSQSANLNLGLLRGAFRPCVIVEVMTRADVGYDFLDYTQHTERGAEIVPKLLEALVKSDPGKEDFRLQITDTAIGGFGATHIAEMLIGIKESAPALRTQRWKVFLNLLHDRRDGTNTGKMRHIEKLSTDSIEFNVSLFEVPDLITEDYDGGLGLKLDGKILKPCHEPGAFVLQSADGISLINSNDLRLTFDQLFTQSVTDGLVTSPHYNQVGDIWNRWEQM